MSSQTLALILAAALVAAPLAAQTPIAAGETVAGTLQEGDRQMEEGAYYDAYVLRGRPGEIMVVRMTSEDFDTYLYWGYEEDEGWVAEAENDDSGDATDSRLVVRVPEDGGFELRAAGFGEGEEGDYELRVTAMGEPRAGRIRVGQTLQGQLDESDFEGESGYEDHYVITGAPGTQVTVFAESEDFDTYLVFGPWRDGALDATADDDDGGRGTNSEMVAEFGSAGEHRILVRSYSGDETGAYTLRVVEGAVSENWNDDDEGDGDGGYYEQFGYTARAGERLTIRVTSDDMDAFVRIGTGVRAEFETLAEDDDGGGELNAELVYVVPRSGEYTIQVSAAAPGQTGAFELSVESSR